MKVHELAPAPGAKRDAKRVARGTGGKGGKTAGRGTKGQRARNTVARGFEGGQNPLKQRVPKLKGFNNPFRVEYQAVNLHALADLVDKLGDATRISGVTVASPSLSTRSARACRLTAWNSTRNGLLNPFSFGTRCFSGF